MGLFSRKSDESQAGRRPSDEEVAAAGRALQVRGNKRPADRLYAESGEYQQETAMRIMAAAAEYPAQD